MALLGCWTYSIILPDTFKVDFVFVFVFGFGFGLGLGGGSVVSLCCFVEPSISLNPQLQGLFMALFYFDMTKLAKRNQYYKNSD